MANENAKRDSNNTSTMLAMTAGGETIRVVVNSDGTIGGTVTGTVTANPPSYTTVACGELAGNIAATQMPTVTCKLVRFKAHSDNAGKVYIGGAGVTVVNGATDTTTGIQLSAGDDTGWLPVGNLNVFYRICDNAGDDLTYLALA